MTSPGEVLRLLADAGVDMSADELLDALWLARHLPADATTPLALILEGSTGAERIATASVTGRRQRTKPPIRGAEPSLTAPDRRAPHAGGHEAGPDGEEARSDAAGSALHGAQAPARPGTLPALPVRVPEAKALTRDELPLGRALRPLKRNRPDLRVRELDERATVTAMADTGLLDPVMRPARTRWLDLVLLVDDGVSMLLWRRLVTEVRQLLERSGAFRTVRVYGLDSRGPDAPRLSSRPYTHDERSTSRGLLATDTSPDSALLLVMSDGVGAAWHDGRMHDALARAARLGPVAVMHTLPRPLRDDSGIRARQWQVTTRRAGAPNHSWEVRDPVLPPDLVPFDGLRVPVLEPTPDFVEAWAGLVTAAAVTAQLPLLDVAQPALRPPPGPDASDPGQDVLRFRAAVTPEAYRLAAHLAACAPVTVPVMRLVQMALGEHIRTSHLAEVFLGGLMLRTDSGGDATPPEDRVFDFPEETRRILMSTVPPSDLLRTSRSLGTRLHELIGRAPEFSAWLADEQGAGRVDGASLPFAITEERVLGRLGLTAPGGLRLRAGKPAVPVDASAATAVVITTLPMEYAAVRVHLDDPEERVHPTYGTRAEIGRLAGTRWRVAVLEPPEAPVPASLIAQTVFWLEARVVLFVGIAGSLKDSVTVGDVVVATEEYVLRPDPHSTEGSRYHPELRLGSPHLQYQARLALREDTRVHFGRLVALPVVGDGPASLDRNLWQYVSDAIAVSGAEMAGSLFPSYLEGTAQALAIRGISDTLDAAKQGSGAAGTQRWAAAQAAAVAVKVLRESAPESIPHPEPETPPALGPMPTVSTPPLPPYAFTGRSAEVVHLLALLDPSPADDSRPPLPVCAVTGMGGIGKTALAVQVSHLVRARGWFPGGVFFADLRGYDTDPVTAGQAVAALLPALGLSDAHMPSTSAQRFDAYRAFLAERRQPMLLIFDNAGSPDQFLPLLPPTGRHRFLITSRDRPPDSLPVRLIDLSVLSPDDSVALLRSALRSSDERDDRASREPEALRALAELCGHLPLALQVAAALLRRRRHRSIASLVSEIEEAPDPTAVLRTRGVDQYGTGLSMRPVLETSYRRLMAEQARLLRLLAVAPGPDTSTEAAAVLADRDTAVTLTLLDDIAAAGLVTPVPAGESGARWRLHDLVRAFAAGLAASDPSREQEAEAARERLLAFYASRAHAADDRLRWLPGRPQPERFDTRAKALAWFDQERPGLMAAVQWAGEERFAPAALTLSAHLAAYLEWRRLFDDWITVSRCARDAARRADNVSAEADAWSSLGRALQETGRPEEAMEAARRALGLYQGVGDRRREAMAWQNVGDALRVAGRPEEAMEAARRALGLYQEAGDRRREATAWNDLGHTLRLAGRSEEAVDAYGTSAGIMQGFEDWYGLGRSLENLAILQESAGATAKAREAYARAAEAYSRTNAPVEAARSGADADRLGRTGADGDADWESGEDPSTVESA
ncbi:SAV_2336 N-terminal domain-related protein [Streptomyces sp. NPDC001093]|uniref:SAV_2336 N-terminal domain-related protein n=1 Tax=Streptomyces sp. NPDC001093 TaxID=3154376 RepID=UPI003322E84A